VLSTLVLGAEKMTTYDTADVQKSLPARPQVKPTQQAYPQGYVEDVDEPRTKLEAFFNILNWRTCQNGPLRD